VAVNVTHNVTQITVQSIKAAHTSIIVLVYHGGRPL